MKCQNFRELIDSYLCDELLTETNHEVLHHLEQCANCRNIIEERRIFRTRLRSAVKNCEELKISENFQTNLSDALRRSVVPKLPEKKLLKFGGFTWTAVAASLLVAVGLSFWMFRGEGETVPMPDLVEVNKNAATLDFEKVALGDHQDCAINHNLSELPVEIDLASPQYADLRRGILLPLQDASSEYKLSDSHICKYKNHTFTHLIFERRGKIMSVLLIDKGDHEELNDGDIRELFLDNYQIAHFNVDGKTVFVISDLSERENSRVAQTLKNPLRRELFKSDQARLFSFAVFEQ